MRFYQGDDLKVQDAKGSGGDGWDFGVEKNYVINYGIK